MSRPSIALCMIVKNEARNIGPMLQSVRDCMDEIHITDTGSTDGTVEFLEKINEHIANKNPAWSGFPQIQIHKFEWINDFAAARNYSFSFAKSDYNLWLDADDRLSDQAAFISWRDNLMHSAHYWLARYDYAFDQNGKVECQFIRERVVARDYGFKWRFFVHEGLIQDEGKKFWPQRVNSWWVNHARTEQDKIEDHMRNIKLIETHDVETMPARMKFYYGKELVEHGFPEKGGKPLMEAIKAPELDIHDRVLAIQYAGLSAVQCKAYAQAIDILFNGLRLMPSRAEYWCLIGDTYFALGSMAESAQAYACATTCRKNDMGGIVVNYDHAYGEYPHQRLAQMALHSGDIKEAQIHISWLKSNGHDVTELERQLCRVRDLSVIREGLPKTDDIVITCPPVGTVTDWDENTLKSHGHGGSETAAIEVAKWLKEKTGRNVKLFQPRKGREVMPSGVEYLPTLELEGYFQNVEPAAHIAWRHATRLTNAKSFVWCHDLQCQGAERGQFDKIVALSGFHKNYLMETNGVPEDKIALGFNGINPADFAAEPAAKDPLKVVFSSSPDRGLVQSIDIVKAARKQSGLDIKLHCFYGTANMRKMGLTEWADRIENKIKENSEFVIYHGMVTKPELMRHFQEAAVWLYPADFIETYCITAIEALCAGAWPIVRDMGALKYTMKEAIEKDMCDVLGIEVKDEASIGLWANTLVSAIIDQKWRKVRVDLEDYSWERVAEFFIEEMGLCPSQSQSVLTGTPKQASDSSPTRRHTRSASTALRSSRAGSRANGTPAMQA